MILIEAIEKTLKKNFEKNYPEKLTKIPEICKESICDGVSLKSNHLLWFTVILHVVLWLMILWHFILNFTFSVRLNTYSGAFLQPGFFKRFESLGYFRRRAPLWMTDRILNATLPNNVLYLEGLRRTFLPLGLQKGILDSRCFLIFLIYIPKTKTTRWNLGLIPRPHFLG